MVEVEVNLRPTVSRPVCLGVRHPFGTRNKFFFLLEMLFRQLRVCYFVAPSLTRGRVCNLLYNCFWALPEQSLLGRSPAELTAIFYCLISDSPNLEGQVPVFISPRNRVTQLYPGAFCGAQNGIGALFLRVILFPLPVLISGTVPRSTILASTLCCLVLTGSLRKETSSELYVGRLR
jgi:hypothetical protein